MGVTKGIELDPVLDALKPLGKYQVIQSLICFLTHFSSSYTLFNVVFTGQKVEHHCAPPADGNLSNAFSSKFDEDWLNTSQVTYGECSIVISRNVSGEVIEEETDCLFGKQYAKPVDSSFVSEFDLVCGQAALANLSQTMLILGQAIGAVFFTALSDRFGRKKILNISHALLILGNFGVGFAPNYITFIALKLVVGAVQQGVLLTSMTAVVETYPGRYRGLAAGFVASLWWGGVTISLIPWAFFLRQYSWRVLFLALNSVGLVLIIQLKYLREPMRWLLANERTDEVVDQLKTAAKINKVNVQKVLHVFRGLQESYRMSHVVACAGGDKDQLGESTDDDGKECSSPPQILPRVGAELKKGKTERLSFLDIVRHKILRTNIICLWILWFVNSLTFLALIFMSESLTNNLYLGYFLNIVVEIPASFILIFTVERLGRRGTLLMFHSMAALSLLACSIMISFPDIPWLRTASTVMSLIGKLGVSGSFACVFFYTPELFPTNIRNVAYGIGSAAARVGGMVAPFVSMLADRAVWAPSAFFAICNVVVLFVVCILPDSRGRELPQTVQDLEDWYKKQISKDKQDSA